MRAPVCLIIFNRPDFTKLVCDAIAEARPPKLFVVADGPRPNHPEDAVKCAAARAAIDQTDWECEVLKNYSEVNVGCGRRPATGIKWVFDQVEEAIILEDDCVPHPTFFPFCDELLEKYRHDERVMHISGHNYQFRSRNDPYSYFFSYHNFTTGWASWRRAWRYHDMELKEWPELRGTSWLPDIIEEPRAVEYWASAFDRAYDVKGNVSYWDHQWLFACWSQRGLAIRPTTNLVANIGFGRDDATHTKFSHSVLGDVPVDAIRFPLEHPPHIVRNADSDRAFVTQIILKELARERRARWMLMRRWAHLTQRHPSLKTPRSAAHKLMSYCGLA